MLIAADDVDEFVDVSDRARAASLLPDAGPGWRNEDLLEFEPGALMIRYLSSLDVDALDEESASVGLTFGGTPTGLAGRACGAVDRAGRRAHSATRS